MQAEKLAVVVPELVRAVALYCDGGVIGSNPSAIGGTWAWCAVDLAGVRFAESYGVRPGQATNNFTEWIAAVRALEAVPSGWSGKLCSDSLLTLNRLFKDYPLNNLPEDWITRAADALNRLGHIEPVHLSGHPTRDELAAGVGRKGVPVSIHNVWCDEACQRAAKEYRENGRH